MQSQEELLQRLIRILNVNEVTVSGNTVKGNNFSFQLPSSSNNTINRTTLIRR
jgi:parallel beta-helix repeat protein